MIITYEKSGERDLKRDMEDGGVDLQLGLFPLVPKYTKISAEIDINDYQILNLEDV